MKHKQIPSLDLYILTQLYYITSYRHINHIIQFLQSSRKFSASSAETPGSLKLLLTNLYVTHGGAVAEDLLHLQFGGGLSLDV